MASIMQFALIIAMLLVIVNGAMDGAVEDGINDFMFSDEKADMRNSAYCMAGLMIYPPTTEIFGVTFPAPSFDDIIIAGAITGVILFILSLIKRASPGWKGAILIFVVVWFLFKMFGWVLIQLSGSDCQATLSDMAGYMDGLYSVMALAGMGALYKVVRASRGM